MPTRTPVRTLSTNLLTAQSGPVVPPEKSVATVEARLTELQDQLNRLKAQVRQAQQLSNLGTAAAMIAHEVNNLLTPVLSYARASLEANDVELQKKALTVTVRNLEMLIRMSEHVLEMSAAKLPTRERVCVRTVVEDAAASLCRDLSKDGIRFSVKVDKSLIVWADRLQLQQVLFNLFLNAREAMAASHSGRLTVSAVRQDDSVVIEVRNSGENIPPDLLSLIFDPFQTSKSATRNGRERCAGLGLALCRDLVEENNGTISVTSNPHKGTTFTIVLPAGRPGRTHEVGG